VRILVADDDAVSLKIVEAALHTYGHECELATDGATAWQMFESAPYDVVITDREMPGLSGLELTRRIRQDDSAGQRAYILLLTGLDSLGDALDGMVAGADDYLTKPLDRQALQMRLIAATRLTTLHRQLETYRKELEQIALTDALTGLGNRIALRDDLERCHGMVQRYDHCFCVALIDIDHFKAYNDTYGHLVGDRALIDVTRVLATAGRTADRAYRYGGEEFVVILPQQHEAGSATALERIRRRVVQLALPHEGSSHRMVTISIGAALMHGPEVQSVERILGAADTALYAAKEQGRNRVVTTW
jgi:diguanylate cyclase (GGDEF)-like protein